MLYNIFSGFGSIFAHENEREQMFLGLTGFSREREDIKKKKVIMERANDTIKMLEYQMKRYKAMKKGAACQSLQYKLQKLMSQQQVIAC